MIRFEVDSSKVRLMFNRLPVALREQIDDAFDYIGRKFYKVFNAERLKGPPGIKSSRGGIALRFKKGSVWDESGKRIGVHLFAKSRVAVRHEEGAVVTNPNGGQLPVPLSGHDDILRTAGGRLRKKFRNPLNVRGVFKKKHKGQVFLFLREKGSKGIVPIFVMKDRIVNKPRLGFYATGDRLMPEFEKKLRDKTALAVRQAGS